MEGHEGHRQRLKQRFLATNLAGFAEHEVLELLLSFAIARKDVKPLAKDLLSRFGSLAKVLEADVSDLVKISGIGEHAAALLKLMLPLMQRYAKSKEAALPLLKDALSCKAFARTLLLGEKMEHFEVVALDAMGKVLATKRIASGDENHAVIFPRSVAAFLLSLGASRTVIAHNHCSGDASPSREDISLTNSLLETLARLDIRLVDHIIISANDAFSFAEQHLL